MNAPTPEIKADIQTLGAAVVALMGEVKRLEKANKNDFANYMFTSVDDHKDFIRPLMAKYNLFPSIDELSFKLTEVTTVDKAGKSKVGTVAIFKFSITLEHISGEKAKRERRTVALPFVGAQTSGIALSFVLKEWFKSRFLVSSGDQRDEADLMDNTVEMRLGKQAARTLEQELRDEMNAVIKGRDHIALRDWWKSEDYRIKTLPKDWEIGLRTDWITEGKTLKAQADLDKATNDELDKIAEEQE